jgi:hypothetical protein
VMDLLLSRVTSSNTRGKGGEYNVFTKTPIITTRFSFKVVPIQKSITFSLETSRMGNTAGNGDYEIIGKVFLNLPLILILKEG